jgi:hypothetical protein
LRKVVGDTEILQTVWLPSAKAIVGNVLRVKNRLTREWEDGWEVVGVSLCSVPTEYVIVWSEDHKRTRKASDI